MKEKTYGPIPGSTILKGIAGHKAIVMAANARIATVAQGIFQAAKDTDSAVFMELARSECDLKGGYTGMTPADFSAKMQEAAQRSAVRHLGASCRPYHDQERGCGGDRRDKTADRCPGQGRLYLVCHRCLPPLQLRGKKRPRGACREYPGHHRSRPLSSKAG